MSDHRRTSPPIEQAGAIPFRVAANGHPEFCLITSSTRPTWGFPKGVIDPGESYEQTALKESFEEAGLVGQLIGEPLGTFQYNKWGSRLRVQVGLMQVRECRDSWEEQNIRERRWASGEQALELLGRREWEPLLQAAIEVLR